MTLPIYPDIVKQKDLTPEHFGSVVDDICQQIRDATKGWGANKQKVIDALATQDSTRRHQVNLRYKEMFEKDLDEVMKKEFSGDFGLALKFLSLPMDRAEAAMIRKATAGVGASVKIVWSIMCGRTNEEMEILKKTYFDKYDKDLGKLMGYELHGDMERLVFNCMQACEEVYDPQFHTNDRAVEDAEIIHKKGQGRWGTDERGIFKVLCASPPEHLENISKEYAEKYGYTLMKAMEKEMTGEVQLACLHMLGMKLKPYETLAKLIRDACAGFGTDELLLTCTLIRSQAVMASGVQAAHIEMYGKTIQDRIRHEASGDYKSLLLQIMNTVWPEEG